MEQKILTLDEHQLSSETYTTMSILTLINQSTKQVNMIEIRYSCLQSTNTVKYHTSLQSQQKKLDIWNAMKSQLNQSTQNMSFRHSNETTRPTLPQIFPHSSTLLLPPSKKPIFFFLLSMLAFLGQLKKYIINAALRIEL
jgi:hypothetical protein